MTEEQMKKIIIEKFENTKTELKYNCTDRTDFTYQFAKANTLLDLAYDFKIITWDERMEMRNEINKLFETFFNIKF